MAALQDAPPLQQLSLDLPPVGTASRAVYRALTARGCIRLHFDSLQHSLRDYELPVGLQELSVRWCIAMEMSELLVPTGAEMLARLELYQCLCRRIRRLTENHLERLTKIMPNLHVLDVRCAEVVFVNDSWLCRFNKARMAEGRTELRVIERCRPSVETDDSDDER